MGDIETRAKAMAYNSAAASIRTADEAERSPDSGSQEAHHGSILDGLKSVYLRGGINYAG